MKKITIGRGRECDIKLPDTTDKVSRRQAVITITPLGKMMIYDTSANGTYVNGEKIEKPAGKPIKRGDNVNFAHMVDLDWSKVKNPYKKRFITLAVFLITAGAVVAAYLLWGEELLKARISSQDSNNIETTQKRDSVLQANDSLVLEIPKETPTPKPVVRNNENNGKKPEEILSRVLPPISDPKPDIEEPEPDDPALRELMHKK